MDTNENLIKDYFLKNIKNNNINDNIKNDINLMDTIIKKAGYNAFYILIGQNNEETEFDSLGDLNYLKEIKLDRTGIETLRKGYDGFVNKNNEIRVGSINRLADYIKERCNNDLQEIKKDIKGIFTKRELLEREKGIRI